MTTTKRRWAEIRRILVVSSEEEFRLYWPQFVSAMGRVPLVGINCKLSSTSARQQYNQQRIENESSASSTCSHHDGRYDHDVKWEGDEGVDERTRAWNQRRRAVALIQLAAVDGTVLLLRLCYFERIPSQVDALLRDAAICKIGQGLERDMLQLQDTWRTSISGHLDIRNLLMLWPWFVSKYDFDGKFGVRSTASFLFRRSIATDKRHPWTLDLQSIPSPFYATRFLDRAQVANAASEAQLALDVALTALLRVQGWPMADGAEFGQTLYLCCVPHLGRPFLDAHMAPGQLRLATPTAARRLYHKQIHVEMTMSPSHLQAPALCHIWAWQMQLVHSDALSKLIVRNCTARALPCRGVPFVVLNGVAVSSSTEEGSVWRLHSDVDKYRLKIIVTPLTQIEGGYDGTGNPIAITHLGSAPRHFYKAVYPRMFRATLDAVEEWRMRIQWNSDISADVDTLLANADTWHRPLLAGLRAANDDDGHSATKQSRQGGAGGTGSGWETEESEDERQEEQTDLAKQTPSLNDNDTSWRSAATESGAQRKPYLFDKEHTTAGDSDIPLISMFPVVAIGQNCYESPVRAYRVDAENGGFAPVTPTDADDETSPDEQDEKSEPEQRYEDAVRPEWCYARTPQRYPCYRAGRPATTPIGGRYAGRWQSRGGGYPSANRYTTPSSVSSAVGGYYRRYATNTRRY